MEDIVGIASCGCVYHAEEGIPCEHDIALAKQRGLLCSDSLDLGYCLDDAGWFATGYCEEAQDSKSVTSAYFAKEFAGKCNWRRGINCSTKNQVWFF